jgi:hypothetical protein
VKLAGTARSRELERDGCGSFAVGVRAAGWRGSARTALFAALGRSAVVGAIALAIAWPSMVAAAQDPGSGNESTSSGLPMTPAQSVATEEIARAIHGRIFTLDGQPVPELRVRYAAPGLDTSAAAESDGSFRLRLPRIPQDTGLVVFDVVDTMDGEYHPALLRLAPHELADEIRLVLIPRNWTIQAGFLAGRAAKLDLKAAFEMPPGEDRLSLLMREGAHSPAGSPDGLWPATSLPIPVAFLQQTGSPEITSADTAAFWRIVERFQQQVGRAIFRPAQLADFTEPSAELPTNGITVEVAAGLYSPALAGKPDRPEDGRLGWIAVREPAVLHDPYLVVHELMHTLGFGHTCAVLSVMSDTCNHGPRPTMPTVYDVAYLELRLALREAMLRHSAPYGLLEALNGERVLVRQLPAEAGVLPPSPLLSSYRVPPAQQKRAEQGFGGL